MSHNWVYSVTLTPEKMTLSVEVTDFQATTGPIEITGEATQVNGAWARISTIAYSHNVTKEGDKYFVDVEAVPTPDHQFTIDEDVTIFVRASKTWVTVLGPGTDEPDQGTQVGQVWGKFKKDSQLPAGGKEYLRSHSWVYRVTLTDGEMTFHVEVTDLEATEGAIEITGEATQVNGAWARVSSIADRATATEEDGKYFVDVEGVLAPDHQFTIDEDVTTFVRVSKTWVTVLGPGTDEPGKETQVGQIWGIYKKDSQLPAGGGPQTAG
jgi:hypothetical protein